MDILGKLFGGEHRIKMMRLFLFNPEQTYLPEEIVRRSQVGKSAVKKELAVLAKAGVIKRKKATKLMSQKRGQKEVTKLTKIYGWTLDRDFPYLAPLQNLLIRTVLLKDGELANRLDRTGKIKLLITAGVFTQDPESRVDLLIVGDSLKRNSLTTVVRSIEAEIGREIRYSAFETPEFQYRLGMYDKLIRDIIDFPHKKVIDRFGVVPQKR